MIMGLGWFLINLVLSLIFVPLYTKGQNRDLKLITFIFSIGFSPIIGIPLTKWIFKN